MNEYAGWITLGAKIDGKTLEKSIRDTKKELEKFTKEQEKNNEQEVKLELDVKEFERQYNEEKARLEKLRDSYEVGHQNYKAYQTQINYLSYDKGYEQAKEELQKIRDLKAENNQKQKELNNKIDEYVRKLRQKKRLEDSKKELKEHSKNLSDIIKKVGRWAIAIFGIRSVYSFIRRSMSTLSQYNQQLAADLEYIRYAIAVSMEKAVTKLVEIVYQLLLYLNEITKAWFNINLFEKASANSFKNANKNAKDLKKTLTSFDEVNTVSKTNSSSGISTPSTDLSTGLNQDQIPQWLKWIIDNKELILGTLGAIAGFVVTFKVASVLSQLGTLFGAPLAAGGMGLLALSELLLAIAAPVIIYFVAKGVNEVRKQAQGLADDLRNGVQTSQNLKDQTKELGDQFEKLADSGELTSEQIKMYNDYLSDSADKNDILLDGLQDQDTWLIALTGNRGKLIDQIDNELDRIELQIDSYGKLYEENKENKDIQDDYIKALGKTIATLEKNGRNADDLREKYKELTGEDYKVTIETEVKTESAGKKFASFFSQIGQTVKELTPFNLGKTVGGLFSGGEGLISKIKKIWSATGSIVNLPGKGVPVGGNVYAGEAGKEGILPLTNPQAMEELGSTIGRYITIDLTNITNFDGRAVARNQRQVNADKNFLLNR